jgi:hypothetical protein
MSFNRVAVRLSGAVLGLLAFFSFAQPAQAVCSSPLVGGWRNTAMKTGPGFMRIRFSSCGDTSGAVTSFAVQPYVLQSTGKWFQRPTVKGRMVRDKQGQSWLRADVPTGGYVDEMWIRNNGNDALRVFIKHRSLDIKPHAQSWHDFTRRE